MCRTTMITTIRENGVDAVVAFNPYYFNSLDYSVLADKFESGAMIAFDSLNNEVPSNYAITIVGELVLKSNKFMTELNTSSSISASYSDIVKVEWNIVNAKNLISIVRSHMIAFGLSEHGLDPVAMFNKLYTVIDLVNSGMYAEAALYFKTIERDAFLTDARIAFFVSLLNSADALKVVV